MMDIKKKISVIIPTYNRKNVLKRAIDSVLNQTYQPVEIIIVDDASTDGTFDYINELYGEIEHLVYIVNEENMGQSAARNIGVRSAKGEFVAFLDSDDEWNADKLEKQMTAILNDRKELEFCYSSFVWKWKDGIVGQWPPKELEDKKKKGEVFSYLLLHPLVGMITVLMKRELFLKIGGFNEDLKALEDYEFTIRAAQTCSFAFVDEVLATAYVSEKSVGKQNEEKILTQCYIMKKYAKELEQLGVRRHIVGGTNRTLISVILPPRLHSPVGDRRLLAGQPHAVVALFQRQDSCF